MKVCSVCGAKYIDRVSFCFNDGSVLELDKAVSPFGGGMPPAAPALGALGAGGGSRRGRGRSLLGRGTGPGLPGPGLPGPGLGAPPASSPPAAAPNATPDAPEPEIPGPDFSLQPMEFLNLKSKKKKKKADEPAPAPKPAPAPVAPSQPLAEAPLAPAQPESAAPPPSPPEPQEAPKPAEDTFYDEVAPAASSDPLARAEPFEDEEEEEEGSPVWLFPLVGLVAVLLLGGISVGVLGLVGGAAINAKTGNGTTEVSPKPPRTDLPSNPTPEIPHPPTAPPEAPLVKPGTVEPVESGEPAGTNTPAGDPVAPEAPNTPEEPPTEPSPPSGTGADNPPNDAVAVVTPPPDTTPWQAEPQAAKVGTVKFSSSPSGADVKVNGTSRGQTPLSVELPLGGGKVEMSLAGHSSASSNFDVKAGSNAVTLTLKSEGRTGAVMVFMPGRDGDNLFVDGKAYGTLPGRATLTEGTHTFTVKGPKGEVVLKRDVKFNAAGTAMVMLNGG